MKKIVLKRKLVHAICIDYQKISTICTNAFCNDNIHQYPSCCNLNNRYITTKSLCLEDFGQNICIRIDNTTKRISLNYYSNRTITLSKRKFKRQHQRVKQKIEPISSDDEQSQDIRPDSKNGIIIVRFD